MTDLIPGVIAPTDLLALRNEAQKFANLLWSRIYKNWNGEKLVIPLEVVPSPSVVNMVKNFFEENGYRMELECPSERNNCAEFTAINPNYQ